MVVNKTKNKLAASLLTLLLCRFSCVDISNTYDASKMEIDAKESAGIDEAVDELEAPLALPSDRLEAGNSILYSEMGKGEQSLEDVGNETLAANGTNSSEIDGHLWPGNTTSGDGKAENSSCASEDCSTVSKPRWNCSLLSLFGENEEPKVIILRNETQLTKIISNSNESQSCFLLYFFVNWCEFCAEFSVEINAIGRSFYGLPVIAVDAYTLSSIAGKFGITGVPCLILFYDGRPVAKFNKSRALQSIEDFITNSTGLVANKSVEIHEEDFAGPLPTKVEANGDIYLIISVLSIALILFINLCFTDRVSALCLMHINRFKEWAVHQKNE